MNLADRDAPIADWDRYFLVLARQVARKPKDPNGNDPYSILAKARAEREIGLSQ